MTTSGTRTFDAAQLHAFCAETIRMAGGSEPTATALAAATVEAEQRGKSAVGLRHLLDYVAALRDDRLAANPSPALSSSRPAVLAVDADGGATQLAFERFLPDLAEAARTTGLAAMSVTNAFTAGELGFYTRRITEKGLIGLVCGNSPALMSVYGSQNPVTGTNPLAFGMPFASGARAFDQASSATAWVNVRDAAERTEPIPSDWAVDRDGDPTTDAEAALAGSLLPFGGVKGANLAIMIELLATLGGGSFSIDAPGYEPGAAPPRLGLFALAIDASAFDAAALDRAEHHFSREDVFAVAAFGRSRPPLTRFEFDEALLGRLLDAASAPNREHGDGPGSSP